MRTLIRAIAVVFVLTLQLSPLAAQTQPRQQEEFTPIDQLPPQEQLPAAPLLVGAYAFVLLLLLFLLLPILLSPFLLRCLRFGIGRRRTLARRSSLRRWSRLFLVRLSVRLRTVRLCR